MDARKFAETFGKLQSRYTEAYLESWESYWKLTSDLARNQGSLPDAQKRYAEYVSKQAPAALGKLFETAAEYYGSVLDAGAEMTREFYSAMSPEQTRKAERPTQSRPTSELSFEGFVGDKPARQFVVANKTGSPLSVAFELSEFVSNTGERLRERAAITPDSVSLAPGEERMVECRVPISSVFAQGEEYRSILRASGLPEMQVVLRAKSLGPPAEETKQAPRRKKA